MEFFAKLSVEEYDYQLSEERIAKFPLPERDKSKLLLYKQGHISEDTFSNLPEHLLSDYTLVLNNTKVIRARLLFKKHTGAEIEVFCLQPIRPSTFDEVLAGVRFCTWECTVGNLRKWKDEVLTLPFETKRYSGFLRAKKIEHKSETVTVSFEWDGDVTFGEILEQTGAIPIPPYLKRESEGVDNTRYQTVYSKLSGSVAAPTAGLHFNDQLIANLRSKGINIHEITLHVGAGTFKPMKTDKVSEHLMHKEYFRIDRCTLENLQFKAGKIIAVGTTSMRMLESLYWLGVKIKKGQEKLEVLQWEPYNTSSDLSAQESLNILLDYFVNNGIDYCYAATEIMIVPSYKFRMARGLITNFHQPKSTLLLLVSAFIGNDWRKVYNYALDHDFRFLSYGDGSLLLP